MWMILFASFCVALVVVQLGYLELIPEGEKTLFFLKKSRTTRVIGWISTSVLFVLLLVGLEPYGYGWILLVWPFALLALYVSVLLEQSKQMILRDGVVLWNFFPFLGGRAFFDGDPSHLSSSQRPFDSRRPWLALYEQRLHAIRQKAEKDAGEPTISSSKSGWLVSWLETFFFRYTLMYKWEDVISVELEGTGVIDSSQLPSSGWLVFHTCYEERVAFPCHSFSPSSWKEVIRLLQSRGLSVSIKSGLPPTQNRSVSSSVPAPSPAQIQKISPVKLQNTTTADSSAHQENPTL